MLILGLVGSGSACADWLTIANDTEKLLIVRSVHPETGRTFRVVRIYPGSTYREHVNSTDPRKLVVVDGRTPYATLDQAELPRKAQNSNYVLQKRDSRIRLLPQEETQYQPVISLPGTRSGLVKKQSES